MPSTRWGNWTTPVYTSVETTAPAPRAGSGSYNELAMLNQIPEDYKDILKQKENLGTWKTHNHYPAAWAHAMDTPFQWVKTNASHYGGTANGMVISWPAHIRDKGGIRTQWHHVIDIVPTMLDVTGIEQPSMVNGVAQKPIEGVKHDLLLRQPQSTVLATPSISRSSATAPSITTAGWPAPPPYGGAWEDQTKFKRIDVIKDYQWELYNVDNDFNPGRQPGGQVSPKAS